MSNFEFLKSFDHKMYEIAIEAEDHFVNGKYKTSTCKLRGLVERMVSYIEKKEMLMRQKNMSKRLDHIQKHWFVDDEIKKKYMNLWSFSSDACHEPPKLEHDDQSALVSLKNTYYLIRWLYNIENRPRIKDEFDLKKLEKPNGSVKNDMPINEEDTSSGMLKIVKYFFDLVAKNSPSQEIVGNSGVLEFKVDNRSIPYMVLLRKFTNDKVSNALYPAIYMYKGFDVAFTVYGKGGYCHESWGEIETSKPLIQKYFEENGQIDQVIQQNPKFNYLDNRYEGVHKLSKLNKDMLQLIADDFQKIQTYLVEQRGE